MNGFQIKLPTDVQIVPLLKSPQITQNKCAINESCQDPDRCVQRIKGPGFNSKGYNTCKMTHSVYSKHFVYADLHYDYPIQEK